MMYESDVFHHTHVSSCSSDRFYLIREDSLLQPNTRCYDVCMVKLHLEIADIFRQLAGAGFGGPLLLSTKNRNDITDQYYWSAQPDVPSAVRGALVVCFSVCKTPFLLAPAEG